MTIVLRPFQHDMLDAARSHLRSGVKSLLLQAPTGAGKTVLAGHMLKTAAGKGIPSWFVCHRRELIIQSSRTFARFGINHGIIAAGLPSNSLAQVQVCGVQTLARRFQRLPRPGFIVWDEAHHIAAGQWSAIHDAFPDSVHIGLSATPERLDGTGLNPWFSTIVPGPAVADLIRDGFLSDYRMYSTGGPSLDGVHQVAGDFNKRELDNAIEKSSITGDALAHYKKFAAGKRAVAFNVSIKRSMDLVAQFKAAGIPAEHVDGDTDPIIRDAALERFTRGETLLLSNVDLFGEGVDVPAIEVVIDCAPTMSITRCMQRWGRALRPAPGKTHAVILDHAGNVKRHGLPDDDREWTLDGRRKTKKPRDPDDISIKSCPSCFRVMRSQQQRCDCGYTFTAKPREIEVVEGALAEIEKDQARRAVRREQGAAQTLEDLIKLGASRGYKNPRAWAIHVHKGRQR